jgi:hypothetical protein
MDIPKQDICNAILNKNRVEFIYHDKLRIGEPQCYGINRKGREAIRVYLIRGEDHPERLFLLSEVSSFRILNEHFTKPGPNYNKEDKDMKVIFCQL